MSRFKANDSVIFFHVLDLSTTSSGLPHLESHSQTKESWNQRNKGSIIFHINYFMEQREFEKGESLSQYISIKIRKDIANKLVLPHSLLRCFARYARVRLPSQRSSKN